MSESEPEAATIPEGAVVVAVDGSETADRALEWAARYADLENRPLVIAHSLGFIGAPEAAGMTFDGGGSFVIIYEQWRAGAEALVAEAAGKVAESYPSVSVTSVIEQSDPRQLLLRLAEHATIVVMGSRGRGRFKSLFLGSVAAGVAGQAGCPVVVIPARDDSEA